MNQQLTATIKTNKVPISEAQPCDIIVYLSDLGQPMTFTVDHVKQKDDNISEKFGKVFYDAEGNYITERTGDIYGHINDRSGFVIRISVNI
jgi:hypothetical protein